MVRYSVNEHIMYFDFLSLVSSTPCVYICKNRSSIHLSFIFPTTGIDVKFQYRYIGIFRRFGPERSVIPVGSVG